MPTYRLREAAALLGVSDDTLRRWSEAGRFATERDASGRAVVAGAELARLAEQLAVPPSAPAHSVARTRESARNQMIGLVTKVTRDTVMAQVELQCGPFRIVSLISREAADDLRLEPGVTAVASVKATNVVVELVKETV